MPGRSTQSTAVGATLLAPRESIAGGEESLGKDLISELDDPISMKLNTSLYSHHVGRCRKNKSRQQLLSEWTSETMESSFRE
jgi:hypothetical protein